MSLSPTPSERTHPGRHLGRLTLIVLAALAVGFGSAWAVIGGRSGFGEANGPWRASLFAGAPQADPWTRAQVALGGLLALRREEALYFVATQDSSGKALRSRCLYQVRGTPPPARWWSVTAYADDQFLFDTAERRYSAHGGKTPLDAEGRFSFLVGGDRPPNSASEQLWIPTPGDRGLLLTLRLYRPATSLIENPRQLVPPEITRVGACP